MSLHISRKLLTRSWDDKVDLVETVLRNDASTVSLECEVIFAESADSADLNVTVLKPHRTWSVTPWSEPGMRSDGRFEYYAAFSLESVERIAASIREVAVVDVVDQH